MTQTTKSIVLLWWRTLTKLWKRCEWKENNHLLMTKFRLWKHLLHLKVLLTSKALELYTTPSSDRLLCFVIQTEAGHMYDELRRTFELFQLNFNKLTLNVKRKTSCIRSKRLCMTWSNNKNMNPDFCPKNCALNQDAYLNGCVFKQEINVVHSMWMTTNIPRR